MSKDIIEQVKSIAEDLSNYIDCTYKCDCCGHIYDVSEMEEPNVCPECSDEDAHLYTAMDYLEGVLDIKYLINSDRTYNGARILVACGGPNIWVDTDTMTVDGAWWLDKHSESFTDAIGLDEALEELYNC